jgi:hypothetical protein
MSSRENETAAPSITRAALRALLLAFLAAGCSTPSEAARAPEPEPSARSFLFVGSGVIARVTRAAAADGGELLHGETELSFGARRCVVEDVTLDAQGRLARAEIAVAARCADEPEEHVLLDPATESITVTTARGTAISHAPTDVPWIYAAPASPARAMATPIASFVAARAAAASSSLRHVLPERGEEYRLPRDQVAIETERGTTVVLDHDGADLDGLFVAELRLAESGATLVRVPTDRVAARRCES